MQSADKTVALFVSRYFSHSTVLFSDDGETSLSWFGTLLAAGGVLKNSNGVFLRDYKGAKDLPEHFAAANKTPSASIGLLKIISKTPKMFFGLLFALDKSPFAFI
jgi:hypothetical protein